MCGVSKQEAESGMFVPPRKVGVAPSRPGAGGAADWNPLVTS